MYAIIQEIVTFCFVDHNHHFDFPLGLSKLEELRQVKKILQENEAKIDQNKDFKYKIRETHQRKVDLETGVFVTNCLVCNYTCHYPCGLPRGENKGICWAMVDNRCRICPQKCDWQQHCNNPYRFELYEEEVEKTSEDLKKRYEEGIQGKVTAKKIMQKLKEEFEAPQKRVSAMILEAQACIKRLDEIALKPDPLLALDYIDLLIQSDKQQKKVGKSKKRRRRWSCSVSSAQNCPVPGSHG